MNDSAPSPDHCARSSGKRGRSQLLGTLRGWSRHAWLLHGWLMASLVLGPFPPAAFAEWVDTDSNSVVDSWNDGATTYSVTDLDALGQDIDGDNAYNSEELQYGSNPFVFDTDGDGIDDGTEIHIAIQGAGKSYSLSNWDSNADEVSDHDDFYGYFAVTYPGGQLPAISGATYSDYDGDGAKNPFDSHPSNSGLLNDWNYNGMNDSQDSDSDGCPDENDSHSSNSSLWCDWNSNGVNDDQETNPDLDSDGYANGQDSDPENASLWCDWNRNGVNDDQNSDGDSVPDDNDSDSANSSLWCDWNHNGVNDDQDTDADGYFDDIDSHPNNILLWNDWNNSGTNDEQDDADQDGYLDSADSHPTNALLWSDWNYNGINNDQDLDADGHPDENDSHPGNNALWSDWNNNGTNDEQEDFDGDGHVNASDSHPANNALWSDWNGNNINDDQNTDGDSQVDENDSHPANSGLWSDWNDNGVNDDHDSDLDGVPDESDSHPNNILLWMDWDGNGFNDGQDLDLDYYLDENDSHPSNSSLWSDWNHNGNNDTPEEYEDPDGDNYANWIDSHPGDEDLYTDWDSDSLNDNVEIAFLSDSHDADSDDDGLNDGAEHGLATNPNLADSDGDGLTDGEEVNVFGTNPTNDYSICDLFEWQHLYTDWFLVDLTESDSDGIPDRVEVYYGLDPDWAADGGHDRDGNGINNSDQYLMGIALDADLDRYDEDGDGMSDVFEDYYGLNKHVAADAVADGDEDGVVNHEEMILVLSPVNADTTNLGNSLGDLQVLMTAVRYPSSTPPTADTDENGLPDWAEAVLATPTAPDYYHFTRIAEGDLDGDGMPDVWEHKYELHLRSAVDAGRDEEPDGLTNLTEYRFGSHPKAGIGDGGEFYDPTATITPPTGGGTVYVPPTVTGLGSGTPGSFGFSDTVSVGAEGDEPDLKYTYRRIYEAHNPPSWWVNPSEIAMTDMVRDEDGTYTDPYFDSDPIPGPPPPPECPCLTGGECTCPEEIPLWGYPLDSYGIPSVFPVQVGTIPGCFCAPPPPPFWVDGRADIQVRLRDEGELAEEPITLKFVMEKQDSSGGDWTAVGGQLTVTIEAGRNDSDVVASPKAPNGKTCRIRLVEGGAKAPHGSLSLNDMAGPRYRKIALNGQPIPDSKPQVQSENGEQPEETYVDAYTLQLRHSVSDVYSTMDSTLMPLMVRRDVSPEAFSNTSGLLPHERPNMPFGAGWSSNLCSYILVKSGSAQVIDEMGASQSYVSTLTGWKRTQEENADAKTRFDQLSYEPIDLDHGTFTLKKKFGTTCTYERVPLVQKVAPDRLNGSDQVAAYEYARLTKVVDRWGNELRYSYDTTTDGKSSLIPARIHDPVRPNHQVWIKQSGGLVTEVRGPAGDTTSYYYVSVAQPFLPLADQVPVLVGTIRRAAGEGAGSGPEGGVLGSKTAGLGVPPVAKQLAHDDALYSSLPTGAVRYYYQFSDEPDTNPTEAPIKTTYLHVELMGIRDERGGTYSFQRIHNLMNRYLTVGDKGAELRTQHGLPMLMTQITMPDNSTVEFDGERPILITQTKAVEEDLVTTVSGPAGSYTYVFSDPEVVRPTDGVSPDPSAHTVFLAFKQMEITCDGTSRSESFRFNPKASMALSSATDMSGNTTSYYYAETAVPVLIRDQIDWEEMGHNAANSPDAGVQLYDDPIVERNALGDYKVFTYDEATRILDSVTDERGVKTAYEVDELGRRTSETVSGGFGGGRTTSYTYGNTTFPGFATKVVTDSTLTDTMAATVTKRTPDANGRIQVEEVGAETGGTFTAITETETHFDHNGNKRTVIDARGFLTNFSYDGKHRLTGVTFPDGSAKALEFDAHGNVTKEVNENGVATFHVYDELNRRTQTTLDLNGDGNADTRYTSLTNDAETGAPIYNGDLVQSWTYNALNQPLTETDARGVVTTNVYDVMGRLTAKTVGGQTTVFRYFNNFGGSIFDQSGFKPEEVQDARGVVTRNTYDDLYRTTGTTVRLAGQTAALSSSFTEYDAGGNPVLQTDGLGRETVTEFDNFGQAVRVTYPDETEVESFYTHSGKPWKVINELGAETVTEFDAAGRAIKMTAPEVNGVSAITKVAYDAAGNAVEQEDALGRIVVTEYDVRNRPWRVTAPPVWDAENGEYVRPVTSTVYDALGQVTQVTDPAGNVTTKFYDAAGRVWKMVDPLENATQSSYDPNGNVLTVTDALERTVTNTYDDLNRLTKTVDGASIENEFGYDAAGNRTSVKDGLDQETVFVYDGLNRQTSQTFANGDTTSFVYNAVQKVSQTDANGATTTYTYDDRDRLLTVSAPGLARSYEYDEGGRLLNVTETGKPEATVAYTYDILGRVLTESSVGVVHTYGYDVAGNRITAAYGTGRTILTSYDALNRPETIAEAGRLTRYGYDLVGRAMLMVAGNGQVTENAYDAAGRLTNRTLFGNLGDRTETGVQAEFGWAHDAVGNVTAQHETWQGEATRATGVRTTAMNYDGANRLTTEVISDPQSGVTTTTYAYDAANNRSSKTVTGGTEPGYWDYTYNEGNQLTAMQEKESPTGAVVEIVNHQYDANGNRLNRLGGMHQVDTDHATLSNQGVTYTAAEAGLAGNDLRVHLQAAEPGGSLGVAVDGEEVNVTLAKSLPVRAQWVNQGITYTAAQNGTAGNGVSVRLRKGEPGGTASVAVNGNTVVVTLATEGGVAGTLEDQGILYTEKIPGSGTSLIVEAPYEADQAASVMMWESSNMVGIRLGSGEARPATLVAGGLRFTAKTNTAEGNNIRVQLRTPGYDEATSTPTSPVFSYLLAEDYIGAVTTTEQEVINWINSVASSLLTVEGLGIGVSQIFDLHLSGGGEFDAEPLLASEVVALLAGNEAVSATLIGADGPVVPGFWQELTGGEPADVITTADDVVALLNGSSEASALITASGGGTSVLMPTAQTFLEGGTNAAITSTAAEVVALLSADEDVTELMTVSGEGSESLTAPGELALTGGAVGMVPTETRSYTWDAQNRLTGVTMADGKAYSYKYDYRTRRIGTEQAAAGGLEEKHTAIVFGGGLSLAEYDSATAQTSIATPQLSTVHYVRGPDMGGGVGGLLYSVRNSSTTRYNLSNGRGDIVAQSDATAALTWTASYEAYGKRTKETGSNADKQRANSKDEDPTGLTNEGFRYRDIDTGMFMSRDPAGFVDGPNLYAYVKQNPWTAFDPDGLAEKKGYFPRNGKGQRGVTRLEADETGAPKTRTGANGEAEVKANHYTDWADDKFSWFNGPQGEPNSSAWEPAKKYGVESPTGSAQRNFETNNDPQKNMEAWGDAVNKPAVKAAAMAARVSIEGSVLVMTAGFSRVPFRPINDKVLVIGENMTERVIPYANKIGAGYYRGLPGFKHGMQAEAMLHNKAYIEYAKAQGYKIIDIGPDFVKRAQPGAVPSACYNMERMLTKGYDKLNKAWTRTDKTSGGTVIP